MHGSNCVPSPAPDAVDRLFPNSTTVRFKNDSADVFVRLMGVGPPLLLLHGYPQTHAIWHLVAPSLAQSFTLVMPDLPGYGRSRLTQYPSSIDIQAKRHQARLFVMLMRWLGFDRFSVAGHDRGGRVAHRMALDHPAAVARLAVLDIVPTLYRFEHVDMHVATRAYHWFFLIQPRPLPERLIAADPDFFLRHTLNSWSLKPDFWHVDAYADYLASLRDPDVIAATCDDYRASATVDLEDDRADRGRKFAQALLVVFGSASPQSASYAVLDVWRDYATDVRGRAVRSAHFPAEEAPAETAQALIDFFARSAKDDAASR